MRERLRFVYVIHSRFILESNSVYSINLYLLLLILDIDSVTRLCVDIHDDYLREMKL